MQSIRTLLQDLATLARNIVRIGEAPTSVMLTRPIKLQQEIFDKLAIPIAA